MCSWADNGILYWFFFFFYFIRIFMALISCLRFRLVGTVLTSFDLLRNHQNAFVWLYPCHFPCTPTLETASLLMPTEYLQWYNDHLILSYFCEEESKMFLWSLIWVNRIRVGFPLSLSTYRYIYNIIYIYIFAVVHIYLQTKMWSLIWVSRNKSRICKVSSFATSFLWRKKKIGRE